MMLSALLDAGAPERALHAVPQSLGLPDVEVRVRRVTRLSVSATYVSVVAPEGQPWRRWRTIRAQLEQAALNESVRSDAIRVFACLAEAEAAIHGVSIEDVHFHELGAVDTLVDIVGAITLLKELRVERVICSPIPVGLGSIETQHGLMPALAPATARILVGMSLFGVSVQGELVTPTGAALAATLAESCGPVPEMTLTAVGYGAGTHDWEHRANVVRVLIGERQSAPTNEVVLVETNLDDFLPELIPDAVAACLGAGALDVWTVPVAMKKGRPGLVFAALAHPESEAVIAEVLLRETSSLGVRVSRHIRYELDREERMVVVRDQPVRIKVGRLAGRVVNVAPEHDDCAAVAAATETSVKAVWVAALAEAESARRRDAW